MKLGWIAAALPLTLAVGCASTPRLTHTQVNSPAMSKRMAYAVWAPQDLRPDEKLPLVVFLHGGGDSEESFDEHEVGQHLDAKLAAGEIPRVVMVVPRGELGFWENWYDKSNHYRDWVMNEVVPAVQARYGTLPCPDNCHVAGVSMGGHGAMRFGYYHPDKFASVTALSAPHFDPEQILDLGDTWYITLFIPVDRIWGPTDDVEQVKKDNVFVQWTKPDDLRGIRLMIGYADDDRGGIPESNLKLSKHLGEHGIAHEKIVFPGNHSWKTWTPVIDKMLRFAVWGGISATGPAKDASDVAKTPSEAPAGGQSVEASGARTSTSAP